MSNRDRHNFERDVQLQQKILHYKSETAKLASQMRQMEERYDVKKIRDYEVERQHLLEKYTDLEKKNKNLKHENNRLKARIQKIEEEYDTLKDNVLEIEKVKEELENKNHDLENEIMHLHKQCDRYAEEGCEKMKKEEVESAKKGPAPNGNDNRRSNYDYFFQTFQSKQNDE